LTPRLMGTTTYSLMVEPQLVLADEPSLGLSPAMTRLSLAALCDLRRSLSAGVVLVEQNVREALRVADRVCVPRLGEVIYSGTPDQTTSSVLRDACLR